jgi:hypothetical protein
VSFASPSWPGPAWKSDPQPPAGGAPLDRSLFLESTTRFEEADLIHRYTRAQAIADGVLVEVSATAREAGIRYPLALTWALWERSVAVAPGVACQDEAGRLWDVVWMLRCAVTLSTGAPEVRFAVHVRNDNRDGVPPVVRLKAGGGPGAQGEPAVTVLLPEED